LSLVREIPVQGDHRIQIRFEAFNVLNHPNFDLPDRIFDSPTFAAIQSANISGNRPPRQIQLGVRYRF